ncbi:sigma 54-interacting transcriptional regulator [Idiomarina xiamenensis]|uniref:Transcriptional regulator, NifA subfamily, Fis family protein n=1 Tax=Idiomarina xiamenensis 10-D-4 TaxID=740709 RepID=K2K9D3_9GAMM|nr:sigma-54 dependent transcriptional regulator [Idiomarina xiamenensis]EKE84398.1 Transcriptional regulator, NifA subfamily, Fis family protein [Idiomarina xiamenensis 10-D-4]
MDFKSDFAAAYPEILPGVISQNVGMKKIAEYIEKIAVSDGAVFLHGDTGTGKELFARAIHRLSGRSGQLVSVNCGAIPENLFESLFFGHDKGAFTGADKKQHGFFHQANQGTLFLDEIGELPLIHQAKLLRVLESRQFSRLGSSDVEVFSGRIVSASHVDLRDQVDQRQFREDLWYRLNLFEVVIPPLQQRRDDIPLLAQFFARQSQRIRLMPCALKLMQFAEWPGNIRQLKNTVDKLAVLADERHVTSQALRQLNMCDSDIDWASKVAMEIIDMPIHNKLKTIHDALIEQAVMMTQGNKSEAARLLGVHRKVIERRLAQIQNREVSV